MAEASVAEPSWGHYDRARARDAWTAFWQESGAGTQCVAGAPDILQTQKQHWSSFAASLNAGTRVLDLGCGAGAVARTLLATRRDVQITGIDIAKVPLVIDPLVDLLSDTAMESLPFADASFGAVVSQFGFEYGEVDKAADEAARVLAPGGRFSFLVHHAKSSVLAVSRAALDALVAFTGPETRAPFCAGHAAAFHERMAALARKYPKDRLIAELSRTMPLRIVRSERERLAIWNAIEEALAPEQWLLEALEVCCVAPEDLDSWLVPLRAVADIAPVLTLRKPTGEPIAWIVEGKRTTDEG